MFEAAGVNVVSANYIPVAPVVSAEGNDFFQTCTNSDTPPPPAAVLKRQPVAFLLQA